MKKRRRLSVRYLPYYAQKRIDMAGTQKSKKRGQKKDFAIAKRLYKVESELDRLIDELDVMSFEIDNLDRNGLTDNRNEVKE